MESKPENCDNCGLCCMTIGVPPFTGVGDDRPPIHLAVDIDDFKASSRWAYRGRSGPCVWLDLVTGRCVHYDERPNLCRTFELGGESCLRVRREAKERMTLGACSN